MKGLMFFAAGSVRHGTGTGDMEKLGGLMKRMPWTAFALMTGAVALAALPPLNGFASEWLMYLSLLEAGLATDGGVCLEALFSVGLLALIGTLAAVVFVRLVGIVLLGSPRADEARHAHESSPWMLAPMLLLMALCLAAAVAPQTVAGGMAGALGQVFGQETSATPLAAVGRVNAAVLAAVAAGLLGLRAWSRRAGRAEGPTWGCGYLRPTPRMQYTGRSFAEMFAEHLLPRFLRPRTSRQAPRGLFPAKGSFRSESPDPVSTKVYEPFLHVWAERCSRLRVLQQGRVEVYLVYMLLMVVLALAWVSLRGWWTSS
jgi:NADH:ubiquinone oxidoreductase subunit 5 (subunit L)/multisubunit Na+/H+ antiporter MnhA subunit